MNLDYFTGVLAKTGDAIEWPFDLDEVRSLVSEAEMAQTALEAEQENLAIWKDVIRTLAKGAESWESALDLRDRILAELS